MSSDGYFDDDDDINVSLLNELDAIEAAHFSPPKNNQFSTSTARASPLTRASSSSDFFDDSTFDVDEAELQRLDTFIENAYHGKAAPIAGPSRITSGTTKGKLQTTLFGDVLRPEASSGRAKATSSSVRLPAPKRSQFGQQAPKTKVWDRTAFAKTGWKKPPVIKGKGKSKAKASFEYDDDEEEEEGFADEEDEEIEFEQFPAPFVSLGPPPPMKLVPDLLEAKHWIYPLNQPKRDYQFNIVKHSLFENTLVALPTGLGKTFVAGVVMLNFYRWFPEGKVIFVAPTKPLVSQQIDACHKTCGIPGRDAAELTGEITKPNRARLWEEKRVFYMTPQTLVNDLATGTCDPLDIILIVVDEAHKATGSYAYSQVIRFLMAKNPHFRVLALSATPGSDPEKVQSIIDHLHISRIEIRDEASMDLREYMFTKEVKQHIIAMSDDVNKIKDLLSKLMEDILKRLVSSGIFEPFNVVKLHSYRTQMKVRELGARKQFPWAYVPLSKLGFLARAMGYLMEASLNMCYTCLKEATDGVVSDESGKTKSSKTAKGQLKGDSAFLSLMNEIEMMRGRVGGFGPHPKMEMLKMLMIQHFGLRMEDEGGEAQEAQETRAMVFVTNRGCVDELVEWLNLESPLLRATKFIGQGTDKQGKKGFAQKEQLEVIEKFKAGHFNVLVSTSIGEEGLDIGEVDLIVCYDAQKAPIRMLQRIGRTGRKRTGYVHVLLSEIREEDNWEKAKDTYGEVQKSIVRGDQLELYGDVERLLPDHAKPECLEKKMDIEEYVREEKGKGKKAAGAGPSTDGITAAKKRKRDAEDMGRNIPTGAAAGFVKASELTKRKKKKKVKEFDPLAGEDDDTDREIEAGLDGPRRTISASAAPSGSPKAKKKALRKAATMDGSSKKTATEKKKKKATKSRKVAPPTASQLSHLGVDDSDDMEIENGIDLALRDSSSPDPLSPPPLRKRPKSSVRYSSSPDPLAMDQDIEFEATAASAATTSSSAPLGSSLSCGHPKSQKHLTSSSDIPIADDVIDISSSPPLSVSNSSALPSKPSSVTHRSGGSSKSAAITAFPPAVESDEDKSMAWLLEGDDEPDIEIHSSPILDRKRPSSTCLTSNRDDTINGSIPSSPADHGSLRPQVRSDNSIEIVEDNSLEVLSSKTPLIPLHRNIASPRHKKPFRNIDMLPPNLPTRLAMPSPASVSDPEYPEPSFAVRPAGRRPKKRVVMPSDPVSPLLDRPPASQRRLQRRRSETSPTPSLVSRPLKWPNSNAPRMHNPWIDTEAAHSGDDVSEGSSQIDEVETESDQQFLQGHPETQVSPSYDQTLAYRQSLFTQAPARGKAPVFANRPAARGNFYAISPTVRRPLVSSSPPINRDEPNEYSIGSFVVDDDAEITYASSDT